MRFDLSQSGLKSVITAGIFSLVAIGILLNWAGPVSAQNAVPAKPDTPTLRALHQGMVEVDWNDVSGANRYEVQFYTSSGWIDLPNAGLGIEIFFDGSRAVATGLPEDLGYDAFRVRAGNSVGWSEWSEYAWQMTTHNMDWEGIPVPTIEPTPEPVNTPAAGAPTISGTVQVGEELTASTSDISDADGLTNVSYSYQWIRNDGSSDTDNQDAPGSSYTLVEADEGKIIKVEVSFTDDAGNGESLTSTATAVVAARPNTPATGAPTISGTAQVGETLTAETSGIADADGLTNVSYSYQWVRNDGNSDTDITDATDSSYTLVAADEGQTIKVRVSFTDDADSEETLTSTATEAVSFAVQQQTSNNPATGSPTISGTAQVGETLTADTSGIADTDGLTNVSYSYQWMRNDGSTDTDITGAANSSYTLVDADEGQTIKVKVTFADDAGDEETLTSAATATVAARPNTPMTPAQDDTTVPTISSVTITSDPDTDIRTHGPYESANGTGYQFANYWYRIGDQVTATVTFTENITVTGAPKLRLNVGTSQNVAIFESANGATAAFEYTVTEGDSDTNGISFSPNGLTLQGGTIKDDADNDAALSYRAVPTLSTHKVDGIRPKLQGLTVVSLWRHGFSPYDDVSDIGDEILLHAQFSEPVFGSIAGPPQVNLQIGNESRPAEWDVTALPYYTYLFSYFIQEGDWDSDGVSISAGSVNLNGGYIKDAAGNDAILTHSAATSEWRVDGIRPFVTSIAITSDPGTNQAYDEGDEIEITVTFNEPVYASENNHIEIDIGGTPRQAVAPATTLPAPQEVPFTYTVQKGDHDSNGISIGANKLTSTHPHFHIRDAFSNWPGGNLAYMEHPALPADTTHKVASTEDENTPTPQNHVPTGKPTVGGIAQEKLTLSADVSDIGDLNGLQNATFTYQWIREQNNADTNIPNATGSTYTLTREDVGNRVKVKVSFTDDQDYYEVVTSDPTATVANAPNSPATGAPSINGKTEVHETLVAVISEILDDDGLTNTTFSYQWLSSRDTEIGGATSSTYTLVSADEGKTLKVRVTFTDDAGNEETLTSTATEAVNPPAQQQTPNTPATGAPTITGTSQVPETLTANTSSIVDDDGLTNVAYSYQWITYDGSSDTDIAGETGMTYTLIETDQGNTIKVQVAFTDDADNDESLTSQATARVAAAAPTKPPGIPRNLTGAANSDGTVTLSWDAPNNHSVTGYQILRRSPTLGEKKLLVYVNDTGSAATEYTDSNVVPNELYAYRIKAINAVGLSRQSEFISLTPTQPAEPAQNSPATGRPTISGTLQVGETLTADTSGIADADGLTNVTFSYQWIPDDGSFDADNQDPPGSSYTLFEADEGKTIKLEVSFTDDAGNGESLTSAATAAVAAEDPQSQELPAKPTGLTGTVSYNAVSLSWDDLGDASVTGYQVLRRDRALHEQGVFLVHVDDTGSASPEYVDRDVALGVRYVYRIKARNASGLSERSKRFDADMPVVAPDLLVSTPTLEGGNPTVGTSFTLAARVLNQGGAESAATTVRFYRSADATITTSDTEVGTGSVSVVAVSGVSTQSIDLTAPSDAGTYYYGACVDAVTGESSTNNNCSSALTVTVEEETSTAPDLVVSASILNSSYIDVGSTVTLRTTVRNQGSGESDATTLRYYRSTDYRAGVSGATEVGTASVGALAAGGSSYLSIDLTPPLVAGTYYFVACADAVSDESDTTNNCSYWSSVTVDPPDLTVSVSQDGANLVVGESFTLEARVGNNDIGGSSATTLRYYRSTDATITTSDTELATTSVGALAANGSSYLPIGLTAPSTAGAYYYGACMDAVPGESDTTNNCSRALQVTVDATAAPDLIVFRPYHSAGNLVVGTSFTLNATVKNQGSASSGSTTLRYYRSTDDTITTSDTSLGTDSVSGIASGGTSAQSIDLTAPSDAGTYYYGVCVDSVTDESVTTNNCSSGLTVIVEAEPAPDLVITALGAIGPLNRSYPTSLSAGVKNQGSGSSDATTLRFYRSTDEMITTSDTELGTAAVGGLSPSGTSSHGIRDITRPSEAGTYYYGACVDAVPGESDTTNNCSNSMSYTVE